MPNVMSALNDQIRRVARREVNKSTSSTRSATARYRRDIAALKRELAETARRLRRVEQTASIARDAAGASAAPASDAAVDKARFRADGLRSHRAKLGLSAKDYGRLVGVSGLTVYQWEHGKSRPRKAPFAKLLAVRGMGKREALARLGMGDPAAEAVGPRAPGRPAKINGRRVRGTFKRTAEEMILDLAKGRGHTTGEINAAWKKEGRAGSADNTLSQMVGAGKLKRSKVAGERGSRYTQA
jgi:DNA-binding transcriptional regulator YiaG